MKLTKSKLKQIIKEEITKGIDPESESEARNSYRDIDGDGGF